MEKPNYDEIGNNVKNFSKNNSEILYSPKELVELLGLDVTPKSLGISLSSRHDQLGLLKLHDKALNPYYAFSEICGPRECFEDWCDSDESCKRGKRNPNLKFYHEPKTQEEIKNKDKKVEYEMSHSRAHQILQKGLDPHNASKIYSSAERYCNTLCDAPSNLNPIVTCAHNCKIWEVKNKALKLLG